MSVFIIAEAGVNHDGSLQKALDLIDVAADAGADAVKFQTFRTDEVISRGTAKAAYQERQTGEGDQYEMVRALELDEAAHLELARHCQKRGIEFMSTPFEPWATTLLVSLGLRRIKVASGELTNKPLLRDIAARNLPILLSTGMATLDEVRRAVGWIEDVWRSASGCRLANDLTVLHCTTDYPASPEDLNLNAMETMRRALGTKIGYSDHSLGLEMSVAAVALGASVIEKHFTLNPLDPGPDHAASLAPEQFAALVKAIRSVELALGDGVKKPRPVELPTRELVRRSAFARKTLPAGHCISAEDVMFRRPSGGIGPEDVDNLVGRHLLRSLEAGAKILARDLAE
ncbi:MAG TPA: N-acetylneuraminate synthase [Sphingomicrobium sp.]|nr:N-acetylneuraminate synthase [Sphingomicrobium sp.]